MRLDRLLPLFAAVSLVFAGLISLSSRRAVHSVLTTNLQAAALAGKESVIRSLAVGMRPGNEALLSDYLEGCLGGFGASYAAAIDERGAVVAEAGRAPDDPSRFLELSLPGPKGSLLLRFALDDVRLAERAIALKMFLFTGATAGLALAVWAFLMRELTRREEQLRQADKLTAVGRLAAGLAHEINNPLGSILGFAQAGLARLAPGDGLTPALKGIEEEALRCRNLVQSLLNFSRDGRGVFEEFELAAAVEATVAIIEAKARAQGVTIARELTPGVRAVGDRSQIIQVIMNLCTNALDAMPDGGRLTLRSRGPKDGKVYLEVEDEGTGIPQDIRNRIFDPFFTTKDVGKGTGLGLSLAHEIVIRHRGAVEALFPRERGVTFRVTLPGTAHAEMI